MKNKISKTVYAHAVAVLVLVAILLSSTIVSAAGNAAAGSAGVFNVKDYGAKADGKTLDNDSINKAIIACNKAGGGTVYFPAGTYLSGSIRLKSNVALYLDMGAKILGAANDIDAYDHYLPNPYDMYQDFGHSHWRNSLIWGENLENIAILGPGEINGGGMTHGWNYTPVQGDGDKAIALKLCRNILIKDITIAHGGHFAILPTGCDNMVIDNVKVDTNRDGINIDCCRNVKITNCTINTPDDDGIVPKSSFALGYKKDTENLVVANCIITGYKEGTMLDGTFIPNKKRNCGKLKFGTESNGGFRNVTITNCVFENSEGLSFLSVDGAIMENITVSNIAMNNIHHAPIFMRLGSRLRGPNEPPVGRIRNIKLSNIVATDVDSTYASIISGIPGHLIEDITLSNIKIVYRGGGTKADAQRVVPEKESRYPDSPMFGKMPAYGFYCRHVKNLKFDNVEISYEKDDAKHAFVFEDIQGLILDRVKAKLPTEGTEPIKFNGVSDLHMRGSLQ